MRKLLFLPFLLAPLGCLTAQESNEATTADEESVLAQVIVSAPKLSGALEDLPLSATVATEKELQDRAVRTVKDAAFFAPNVMFTEFAARKLSNPRFRGIGGSPTNPGVTTYIDGVPQFNSNSSSLELLDIEQVDFVRGPAGALFGRNTVGGLINITSRRPSTAGWSGGSEVTVGNYNYYDARADITGPLIQDTLGFSFAGGYSERDGYTSDTISGNDIDNRSSWFGKTQFLWTPSEELEVRFILAGERARDGDYTLSDLGAQRINPRQSARDTTGFTNRDLLMPTLQITYHADAFDFTSTTGFVWWETSDATDLDYSTFTFVPGTPFLTRNNNEKQTTWTQEFRFANPADRPITLGEEASLTWQAGAFFFHQQYDQEVVQSQGPVFFPFVIAPNSTFTTADQRDMGFGIYAQSTLSLWDRLHLTGGLRFDYEDKEAGLVTGRTPIALPFLPPINTNNNLSRSFSRVTPQAAIAYDINPDLTAYTSFAGGYKAGGFNTASPGGRTTFEEETSWNYEFGIKGRALDDKFGFNLAAFYTDWQNLQLNTPNALSPNQFDITNAGDASAYGIELNAQYKPVSGWDLFGSAGWVDTQFHSGSTDFNPIPPPGAAINVSGNEVPFTPEYTASFGTQFSWEVGNGLTAYARGEVQFTGGFSYDSQNAVGQDAYTIANFRVGVRQDSWFAEAFVNNAFNAEYYPIAIQSPLAPSGYLGESGAPATFGMRVGYRF